MTGDGSDAAAGAGTDDVAEPCSDDVTEPCSDGDTEPRSDGGSAVVPAGDATRTGDRGPADGVDAATGGERIGAPTTATVGEASALRDRLALLGRQTGSIATSELRLGLRRRWPVVLVGLFAAFGVLVVSFGESAPGPAGFARTVASLAVLAVYVVPLAALAYGYDAVVGPAERGWLDVLSALPVTRVRVLLGTALGRAVVLTGGVLLGFGVPGGLLLLGRGPAALASIGTLLLAAATLGLAFLSIAVLVSTLAPGSTHALGAALLAWVWFVLVHDLLALGAIAAFELPDAAVAATVLANPAAVYRVLVLDLLGAGGGGGFAGVYAVAGLSRPVIVGALALWAVAPLAAAVAVVRRRGSVAAC